MQGWLIVRHSILMVLRNLKPAFQICLVPILIGFAVIFGLAVFLDVGFQDVAAEHDITSETWAPILAIVVVIMILFFWVYVAWHRFILLNEQPTSWLPAFHSDRVLSYFGHMLLLVLVSLPIMLVFLLGVFAVSAFVPVKEGDLTNIVLTILLSAVLLRFALILPAAALGAGLKLRESWTATKGAFLSFVVVMAIGQAAEFLVFSVFSAAIFDTFIGQLIAAIFSAVYGLIGVSVLTTLYGHYVEGREL